MGNYPPPPPQIVIIRPEPQRNPFDEVLLHKLIERLVLEAINKYFALQRGGTNIQTKDSSYISAPSNEEIPPQRKGEATKQLVLNQDAFAMPNRTPAVDIPQELRDRLMDRDELMGFLEMDIPPGAMPTIAAALAGASLRG